ncbi:MAG: heme o synthase [Gemmatimonadota bacterium]
MLSGVGGVRDLVALTKPRVVSLLLVATLVPMLVAGSEWPPLGVVIWTLAGGYLMAGGANAINMWLDRDIDGLMGRTRRRPLPSGRLHPTLGLLYGIGLSVGAFAMLWAGANLLAAGLAAAGFAVYLLVYTLGLKRRSPQNIVIGGAAGAFPPLVGWAAATGGLDLTALLLFSIIYYWTPPHFWALALVKRRDYAAAGVPMLPVVAGERETRRQMLLYAAFLLPLSLLPSATGAFGWLYAAAATLLGARLLQLIRRLAPDGPSPSAAWALYRFSLLYLALLFAAMLADRLLRW